MAPSTPVTPKPSAVSSRLLSMKFMQRAAATDPGPSSAESSGTKRRKLAHHASPTPAGDDDLFSQAHIRAAMEDTESKRAAAVERRAAELDEARWVIDVPAVGGAERRKPLNVVYVGYGDIDRGEQEGAGDGEAADRVQSGRMATGNYKRKEDREKEKERKQKENKSSGSDDDSDEEGETSDSDSDGTPRRSRSGASAETLRRDAAQDRRKREVKLSRLVSISSGGNTTQSGGGAGASARSMKCYGCGGVGHKASSSECPKNRGGGRKKRGGD